MIVDATFRFRADRRSFAEALGKSAREALWVQCQAPAETLLRRDLAVEPNDPWSLALLSLCLHRRKKAREAIDRAREANLGTTLRLRSGPPVWE